MSENEDRPVRGGGRGQGSGERDRSRHVHDSATLPEAANRLPFTPDATERYCCHCFRLVLRRGHRRRCPARRGGSHD